MSKKRLFIFSYQGSRCEHSACGSLGEGMSHSGAVSERVETLYLCFKILIYLYLGIIELDLHSIKQGVFIGGSRSNFIQRIDHFNDIIQLPLWNYEA